MAKTLPVMSRKGNTQKSTAGQNKTSGRTNKQAAIEEKEYDDEYPPLSTASTVVTSHKSSVPKLVNILICEYYFKSFYFEGTIINIE